MPLMCLWNNTQVPYQLAMTTLCLKKNDTDVAYYNFNAHQLIFVIFGRDIAGEYAHEW